MKVLAAVDDDRLAGDEGGARTAEKDNGSDDILRFLIALQRARGDRDLAQRSKIPSRPSKGRIAKWRC